MTFWDLQNDDPGAKLLGAKNLTEEVKIQAVDVEGQKVEDRWNGASGDGAAGGIQASKDFCGRRRSWIISRFCRQ